MTQSKNPSRLIDRLDIYARARNLTDAQITRDCNLAVGTLGKSRKAEKDLSRRTAAAILSVYSEINPDWFTNGIGDMIRSADADVADLTTYPLIDCAAAECGRPGGLAVVAMEKDCERVAIPGIPGGTDFFIRATGYSMVNDARPELSIPPGALVGVARMTDPQIMHWGEVYLVATNDGFMIKRILQDSSPELVRCASYNKEEYPEFTLWKDEIIECGRITCVMPIYLR